MTDNSKKRSIDLKQINIEEESELNRWSKEFGVSIEQNKRSCRRCWAVCGSRKILSKKIVHIFFLIDCSSLYRSQLNLKSSIPSSGEHPYPAIPFFKSGP